jgi:hypothetical protein
MKTTKLMLGASAATLMVSGSLSAQDAGPKAINTGGDKGAYHTLFCPPLPSALSNAYFSGYRCTPSKGTIENIDLVLKYPTSVGFVQLDMFANGAIKRGEEFNNLTVIRSDIACEGLWMVTKNPDLTNFGHVLNLARRIPVILPPQSSGSAASFAYLQTIDPEGLGRVPETNKRYVADATAVLNELASGTNGAVGFFVQFADPENANIKMIVEKGLKVIPVVTRDILRAKLNGQGVYQLQTYTLRTGGLFVKAREETTACTPVAIITGAPAAFGSDRDKVDDQKDMIQKIRDVPVERLLPQESRINALLKSIKKMSDAAAEELAALVESTHLAIDNRDP